MKKQLIIISPYPENGTYSHTQSALASFNANVMKELQNEYSITVFGDSQNNAKNILKIWDKDSIFTYPQLLLAALKQYTIKNILIQFEWGVFGRNIIYVVFFPFFLALLGLMGKRTTVVLHGVSLQFEPIYGNTVKSKLLNVGSALFHFFLGLTAHTVIVTEEYFKQMLGKISTLNDKVVFIPHGVDTITAPLKTNSQNILRLGFLGFLHEYKGPKELLDVYLKLKKGISTLTYYGGSNVSNTYIDTFRQKAKENNIEVTGFIPQEKIPSVFQNIDIAIFPYPAFISSSGMLAFCYAYEQPFILSRSLKNYFKSDDLRSALTAVGLVEDDLLFDLTEESLYEKLKWVKSHAEQIRQFTALTKAKRSWSVVGKKYILALGADL